MGACGCVARARMCSATEDCGAQGACVAGRCLRSGSVAAIQSARRVVAAPVATAYLAQGAPASAGVLPTACTLGKASEPDARLLLRFAVPIPAGATILEAYLLLPRAESIDVDPTAVALHAARVVEPWDPRAVSWARQPRLEETRAPSTTVSARTGPLVRIDVRALVQRWRLRDGRDQGIAVVAENVSPTGIAFALAPSAMPRSPDAVDVPGEEPGPEGISSPELELYLK